MSENYTESRNRKTATDTPFHARHVPLPLLSQCFSTSVPCQASRASPIKNSMSLPPKFSRGKRLFRLIETNPMGVVTAQEVFEKGVLRVAEFVPETSARLTNLLVFARRACKVSV